MSPTEVKMDDLPILPFEKIFSYLSLEDRIRSRAVSRSWRKMIDSFEKVESLCYSGHPIGFVRGKSRLMSGAFVQNFISPPKIESFFASFGQSILSDLKQLRLCDFDLNEEYRTAFAQTLRSFGQLDELGLFNLCAYSDLGMQLELNLPMLQSIQLEKVNGIEKLTLDAPRLQQVKLWQCSDDLSVQLVHGESVERLLIGELKHTEVKKLTSLTHLYIGPDSRIFTDEPASSIDSTLLSGLRQLKEVHLREQGHLSTVFDQKKRYGRTDLKVFFSGLLLNEPDVPEVHFPTFGPRYMRFLAENPSRLADEMPFCDRLCYASIETVAPGLETNVLSRFTDLETVEVDRPVQDIERFLSFLENLNNMLVHLEFSRNYLLSRCLLNLDKPQTDSSQPQNLFDRLPDHYAVQWLTIDCEVTDFRFLSRLKRLIYLNVSPLADAESVRNVLEELEFLSQFDFQLNDNWASVKINRPKRFEVTLGTEKRIVSDVSSAIQFIFGEKDQE